MPNGNLSPVDVRKNTLREGAEEYRGTIRICMGRPGGLPMILLKGAGGELMQKKFGSLTIQKATEPLGAYNEHCLKKEKL